MAGARARLEPTLMMIEDAHWADPGTVSLVRALIELSAEVPLLFIVTQRPERELVAAQDHVTTMKVTALRRTEVVDLVTRLAGSKPLPEKLLEHILDKTDGVPLFVEELTRYVLEESPPSEVPATLRDSLMARLDRNPRAKEIAQIGAVLGREFRRDLIEAVAAMTPKALDDALSALTQSGLATEHVGQQGRVYTFRHALVQDTSYDSLLESRREALHGAAVSALEKWFPTIANSEPDLVARHASRARKPDVAIPYFRRASELAVQRLALHEAAAHLDDALEACAALGASAERNRIELQLQASLGTIHMLRRGWAAEEVSHAFARANALADTVDDLNEAIWPLWGVCVFHLVRGEIARAVSIGHRMMTVARQAGSRHAWLVADMIHVQLFMYSGAFHRVQMHVEQVEQRYADPQDRALISLYSTDLKLVTMVHGSQTRLFMGVSEAADALCAEQEAFAASLNHPYSIAWTRTWGAMSFLHRGLAAELLPRVEEGLRIAEKHGFAYVASMALIQKGWAYGQDGRLEEGIALMQRGLAAFKATGAGIAVPFFTVLLAEALGRAGRRSEGLSMLDEAERLVEWGGERWHEAELHRVRAQLLAMGPEPEVAAAEASLRRAMNVAAEQHAHEWRSRALRDLAELLRANERDAEARALLTSREEASGSPVQRSRRA
jgi:predicted ATPase